MLETRSIGLATAWTALAVTLGACGGDDETTSSASTTSSTTTSTTTGATGAAGPCAPDDALVDRASGEFSGLDLDCRPGTEPAAIEVADLEEAADAAGCELELDLPDEGNTHIPESKPAEYDTSPPTSGDHDQVPLADGAYAEEPEARYFVHSMEHGRVVILYDPSLPEEDQLALKGVFEDDPDGMVLIPYSEMPYEVAATAWTNALGCDAYTPETLDAIRDFRDEFRGKGPEAIPL
ncbi:MAG TPA: DUF3105 domain-containing protein [Solirubrobacterales bacterium]